jgi:hypothetical protein
MRAVPPLLLLAALAAGCRVETTIEVETRVEADGSGTRTLSVQSRWQDGRAEAAPLPRDFLPPGADYALREQGAERVVATAAFARLDGAAAPFAFGAGAGAARTAFPTRFRAVDWVLFTIVHYEEAVVDAAEPDALRAALEECATVALETADAACARVFGADFDATILRERLRGDLREVARDLAFTIWQEFYAGSAELDALLARALPRLVPAGLELRVEWFGEEERTLGLPRARAAVAAWVEAQLRPRRAGERTPQPVGLEAVLFEGAFAAAWLLALDQRFGGAEGREAWWEGMQPRLKGAFGAGRDDVRFTLRVRMPGTLLRSDGWLEPDGSSFVEFAAHEAFPRGRGIRCASVVWSGAAQAALPTAGLVPDNAAALAWTRVLGDGPDGAPQPQVAELLRACVAARSLTPLEEVAAAPEHELAPAAARALEWLQGARE